MSIIRVKPKRGWYDGQIDYVAVDTNHLSDICTVVCKDGTTRDSAYAGCYYFDQVSKGEWELLPESGPIPTVTLPTVTSAPDKVSDILQERGKRYGPNPFNQQTVAMAWRSTLESWYQQPLPGPIPPHIVALMLAQLKIMRATTPFDFHQDNYDDLHGYTRIAEKCAKDTDNGKKNSDDGLVHGVRPDAAEPAEGSSSRESD